MHNTQQHFQSLRARSRGFVTDLRIRESDSAVLVFGKFDKRLFTEDLFCALDVERPYSLANASNKRLSEFLAGRSIAAMSMAMVGRGPQPVSIGSNREPVWPSGLQGSITHSDQHCAVVLSDKQGVLVGIDTEEIAEAAALETIFEVTLSPAESKLITEQTALAPEVLATLAFSAKETLFKALYPAVGRFFSFDYAEVVEQPNRDSLRMRLTQSLGDTMDAGSVFDVEFECHTGSVTTWLIVKSCAQ